MMTFAQLYTMIAQDIVTLLHDDVGLLGSVIARLIFCTQSAIWHIRYGKQSGRNLLPYLQSIALAVEANECGYHVACGERNIPSLFR